MLRTVSHLGRRIKKSVTNNGVGGTAVVAARFAWVQAQRLRPSVRKAMAEERAFDIEHDVDTAGIIPTANLDTEGDSWIYGNRYECSPAEEFDKIMASLASEDMSRLTFIDVGCGKGRAMFMAAHHPFKRIEGIELGKDLVASCERNIRSFRSDGQRCHALSVSCQDASTFMLPDEPLVLYFNNPFTEPIMAKVVAHLRASLEKTSRTVYVAYYNPQHAELFDAVPGLEPFDGGTWYRIWKAA